MNYIVNAAPMVLDYGTEDRSTEILQLEPESLPQHLPKFYLFTQKPRRKPQLVIGADREAIFGEKTFEPRSQYYNHATVFANLANDNANLCMIESVIPEDAGPESNLTFWLDVLPTEVDLYQRTTDGKIAYNVLSEPTVIGQTFGYKVKWVVSSESTQAGANNFGSRTQKAGDQVDTATSTQSIRYPIFETKSSYVGSDGDNSGLRFWAPTAIDGSLPVKVLEDSKSYPFYLSMVRRADKASAPVVTDTVFGDKRALFSFKKDAINTYTDEDIGLHEVFGQWQNLSDTRYPIRYGDLGQVAVYYDVIDHLVSLFHEAESDHLFEFSDFTEDPDTKYMFNFVSGVNSSNIPYHSFHFVDDLSAVRPTEHSNFYANGGSDGTMNDQVFAELVEAKMANYADSNHEVQELAVNVESIIYDSGFPVTTKYALCKFVSRRRDTFVVLSTHISDGPVLTAAEEYSLAISLRSHLQAYPESEYFGTPVMRGMILGRSGLLRGSKYKKRLPLSAEVLIKSAKYMGASSGIWDSGAAFDSAPGSVLSNMYDISITWVPGEVRNRNWDVGLNWVQAYGTKGYFFPALKTVYDDDTSVLNSYFTALAIAYLNKVAHAAWREFSGSSGLTAQQLEEKVNSFVVKRVKDKFGGRFVVIPEAVVTDVDNKRGFSWTLPIKIYAPSMVTVMTTYVKAYRISALTA